MNTRTWFITLVLHMCNSLCFTSLRTDSVGCGVSAGKIQAKGDFQRRTCLIPTLYLYVQGLIMYALFAPSRDHVQARGFGSTPEQTRRSMLLASGLGNRLTFFNIYDSSTSQAMFNPFHLLAAFSFYFTLTQLNLWATILCSQKVVV